MIRHRGLIVAGVAGTLIGLNTATAEPAPTELADLQTQIQQLKAQLDQQNAELARIRAAESEAWLTDRRREEVKALVHDVLADADTRAALLQDGVAAGYDNGFFIASADGVNKLRINLDSQLRYVFTDSGQDDGDDEEVSGFQARRTRIDFRGQAFSPQWTYRFRLAHNRSDGDAEVEVAQLGYQFNGNWSLSAGQFKPQSIREENVSGFRQLAVERSYAADYFTVDYVQGVELSYAGDALRGALSVHDGSYSDDTDFSSDRTDLALTSRAEYKIAGNWKQFDDFSSWSSDDFGLLVGVFADYELGESGDDGDLPDLLKLSADVSAEFSGFNAFAAVYYQQFPDGGEGALASALDDAEQLGFVVQGGAFVVPDKFELFGRYEWIDFDGVYYRNSGGGTATGTGALDHADELSIVTVGGNYYLRKHNAKLSVDVLYALDPIPAGNSGAGLVSSPDDGQVAVRGQFQIVF